MPSLKDDLERVYSKLREAIEGRDRPAIESGFGEPFPGTDNQWAEAVEMLDGAFPELEKTRFVDVREREGMAGYYIEEELDDPNYVTLSVIWFKRTPSGWIVGQRRFGASFPRDPDPDKNRARMEKEIATNPGFLSPEKTAAGVPELPQPMAFALDEEGLKARFMRVAVDRANDPKWHYRLAVHKDTKLRPKEGLVAPTAQAPVRSLGLFYREDKAVDLEVIGVLLGREIDPIHWLEMFLEFNGLSVVSMKPMALPGGIAGDAVCTWAAEGKPFAGRFVALKYGPRLYVVCCRAEVPIYVETADDFFVTLTQFGAIDDSLGLSAEPVLKVGAAAPVPWFLFIPSSWQVTPEETSDGHAGFQAVMSPPAAGEPPVASCLSPFPGAEEARPVPSVPGGSYLGKAAVTLVPISMVPTAEAAEAACLDTFREAGLELDEDRFVDEPPQGALEQSKLLVTSARLAGQTGVELRCRVGLTHGLWFIAGIVGPSRPVNPFAWMQNKRALDMMTGSLQFSETE